MNGNVVYVTDFGLADERTMASGAPDYSAAREPRLVGTARYASMRGHEGQGTHMHLFLCRSY